MPRMLSFTVRTRLGAVTIRSIVDAGNSKSPVNTTRGETNYEEKSTDSPFSIDDRLADHRKKMNFNTRIAKYKKKSTTQNISMGTSRKK